MVVGDELNGDGQYARCGWDRGRCRAELRSPNLVWRALDGCPVTDEDCGDFDCLARFRWSVDVAQCHVRLERLVSARSAEKHSARSLARITPVPRRRRNRARATNRVLKRREGI